MRLILARRTVLAAAAALVPVSARLAAQYHHRATGFVLGGGIGVEAIREDGMDQTRPSVSLSIRGGWQASPSVAVLLESGLHGSQAHSDAFVPGVVPAAVVVDAPSSRAPLSTLTLLLAVQVSPAAGWYVRPAVGAGSHSFYSYEPIAGGQYRRTLSREAAPAAQLAVGRALGVAGFPLGLEVVGLWSGGEDSTGARWAAGVQLTHDVRF